LERSNFFKDPLFVIGFPEVVRSELLTKANARAQQTISTKTTQAGRIFALYIMIKTLGNRKKVREER
jgi:hypothetical protein